MRAAVVGLAVVGCGRNGGGASQQPEAEAAAPELPGRLYDDPTLARYVADAATCVAHAAGVQVEVLVLDRAEVGAWALPGDRIALTRGLLVHLRSEAELQAVLAHEVAHLRSGHVRAEAKGGVRANNMMQVPAVLLHAVRRAAHSRAQEREADRRGVAYLEACGRSALAMAELFEVLEGLEDEAGSRFFATHPSSRSRRRIAQAQATERVRDPGRAAYLRAMTGVIVGEDPRAGFVLDRRFYVPRLDVRAPVPRGWIAHVEDGVLLAQTPDEDAFFVLAPTEPADARVRVQDLLDTGELTSSEVTSLPIGELQVTTASFAVGEAAGVVAYLEREEVDLFLFGVTPRDAWELFTSNVTHLLYGLGHIEDDALRSVSPLRLHWVELDREATLAEFADRFESDVTVTELARLNGIAPDVLLPAGTPLKRVTGFNPTLTHRDLDLDADDGLQLWGTLRPRLQ